MNFITNISTGQKTDRELLTAFKQSRDIKYLSELYQRYMDLVFGVCLKYFKDAERSKDAVMDIFEELNTKLPLYEVDNFKGWLHVLARNYCLMQLRSPRNMKTNELNSDFMQSADDTHLQSELLQKEENLTHLENCIETLPYEQKQSVQLFYLQKNAITKLQPSPAWNGIK